LLPKWVSIITELAAANIIGIFSPLSEIAIRELHYFFE
jgi:hypothetical protein